MKTLITGATGFIGRHLVQDGCIAMVRKPSGFPEEVIADLLDKKSLVSACDGVEAIIHCAGFARDTGKKYASQHWQINFEGTRNLLVAAQKARVKKLVFISTVKAMANPGSNCATEDWLEHPNSHYGQSKLAAETTLLDAHKAGSIKVTILRPSMVYGPGSFGNFYRLAKGIKAGWFPVLPETKNQRSFLHVEDLVSAIWLAVKRKKGEGKKYIVTDPKFYSGREVYDIIRSFYPQLKTSWHISEKNLRYCGKLGDLIQFILMHSFPVNSEVISRLLDSECYSPIRIQNELGWQPKIGLQEGLKMLLINSVGKV